jgi:putative ABC transport system substrate-binding protein
LRQFGYVLGRNLDIEYRYAAGRSDRLDALAAELVQLDVEAIFAGGPATLEAARNATKTIPIVTVSGGDPVLEGWAQSLARPAGNVTGLTVTFPELGAKRLELLKLAVPGLVRVGMLWAPDDLRSAGFPDMARAEASALGMQAQMFEVRGADDFAPAFAAMRKGNVQAVHAISTNVIVAFRVRIAGLAIEHRVSSMGGFSLLAEAGMMLSYGANLDETGRGAAAYFDKIFKGARPGDLPVERPSNFELVINAKTARAIGVVVPKELLLRASRVIEA